MFFLVMWTEIILNSCSHRLQIPPSRKLGVSTPVYASGGKDPLDVNSYIYGRADHSDFGFLKDLGFLILNHNIYSQNQMYMYHT